MTHVMSADLMFAGYQSDLTALTERLRYLEKKLVVAESCTAGLLAAYLTTLPGSSAWFERGFVTYSNQAKIEMLGVPVTVLEQQGAVSEATVAAMAEQALLRSRANMSIAISGIAGPDGGTPEKPVGLVCFGWASDQHPTHTKAQQFTGDRQAIRCQAVDYAITQLHQHFLMLT